MGVVRTPRPWCLWSPLGKILKHVSLTHRKPYTFSFILQRMYWGFSTSSDRHHYRTDQQDKHQQQLKSHQQKSQESEHG